MFAKKNSIFLHNYNLFQGGNEIKDSREKRIENVKLARIAYSSIVYESCSKSDNWKIESDSRGTKKYWLFPNCFLSLPPSYSSKIYYGNIDGREAFDQSKDNSHFGSTAFLSLRICESGAKNTKEMPLLVTLAQMDSTIKFFFEKQKNQDPLRNNCWKWSS